MSTDAAPNDREDRAELACTVALSMLPGVGPATLVACHSGPGAAATWERIVAGKGRDVGAIADVARRAKPGGSLDELTRTARGLDPEAVLSRHESAGLQVIPIGSPDYPERLVGDPAPPALLFVRGSLAALDGPTVGIVGTRNATRLGCETAASLARGLATCGVTVISGLALGIDGAAHQSIIDLDHGREGTDVGVPIGVVASGLDRPYPRRHQLLHHQVAALGALVSETPMGSRPLRWRFPARNRIIAGLADAVVVVESRSTGGSMLTAAEALARDVPVLAVPGHPTSSAAAGPLDLLADGAAPVRDLEDVLVAIGLGGRSRTRAREGDPTGRSHGGHVDLDPACLAVLDVLIGSPRTLGEVVLAAGMELDEVASSLHDLEVRDMVQRSGGWYEATEAGASAAGAQR